MALIDRIQCVGIQSTHVEDDQKAINRDADVSAVLCFYSFFNRHENIAIILCHCFQFLGSKNQDAGNTSGAEQSPNGFTDQPDAHEMALQNHNLLIALGAARQAGATSGQHFAMPVRIIIYI